MKIFSKFKKLKKSIINLYNIDQKIAFHSKLNTLQNNAFINNTPIVTDKKHLREDIIVSLTTFSKRIHQTHLVIESIAYQTVKPNRIILWLDEKEFNNENIPILLKKQKKRGLEIKYYENIKSYKKIIPTLEMSLSENIITIDDDIIYPFYMIERFIAEHKKNPNTVLCNRAHEITKKNNKIESYKNWNLNIESNISSNLVFPTGIGGIFYPANCFDSEVLNKKQFEKLAPFADDIWLKAMTLRTNHEAQLIQQLGYFDNEFFLLESNQDIGLFHNNYYKNKNDVQFQNVFEHYNLIKKLQ
ncbi:hypothetical protein VU602_20120 [Providencia stuartii]|uniref:hypothetical protein n=1 Tax=Providencia stuartii TaxID=588 RepID=UPI003CEC757E